MYHFELWLLQYFNIALECDVPILESINHFFESALTIHQRVTRQMDRLAVEGEYHKLGIIRRPDLFASWFTAQRHIRIDLYRNHNLITVTGHIELLRLSWIMKQERWVFSIATPIRTKSGILARSINSDGFRRWMAALRQLLNKLDVYWGSSSIAALISSSFFGRVPDGNLCSSRNRDTACPFNGSFPFKGSQSNQAE
jgi:hypothetical protein